MTNSSCRVEVRRQPFARRFLVTLSPCHLVTLSLLLAGCDWPGKPKESDRPIPAEQIEDFSALYSSNCAGCHGVDGQFGPAPPLNDPLFLSIVPEQELRRVIAEGRAGTAMTAFAKEKAGPLTDKQIDVLAKGIKPRWLSAKRKRKLPGSDAPPYLLADAKAGDKNAGRKVFARACAECHGKHGQGSERIGAVNDAAFLAVVSDQALRRYAITGRLDFGMPNYAERDDPDFKPLTSQEINDLVALLAYWRVGGADNGK